MRSFIAITIPDEVKAGMLSSIQRLSPHAVDVAWCGKDQIHLTLAFLGETAPAILPHVAERLTRVCATLEPFMCRAYGLGFFGTKRNPKVLWAGIDPSAELLHAYETVWEALKSFGFKNDARDFRPHVTLGRCKDSARNQPLVEAMVFDEQVSFGTWRVKGLTLFESRLTPRGALYSTLNRFQLGASL